METKIYDLGIVKEEDLKFVVIVSKFKDRYVFAKHKERTTLEVPGGHIELNESSDKAAIRELQEETGAVKFNIKPICDYSVKRENVRENYGRVYYSEIEELGNLPNLEIGEIQLFDHLPKNLTHAEIQPVLFNEVIRRYRRQNELNLYLKSLGASLVGFADLSRVNINEYNNMKYGIAFAIKLKPKVIKGIHNGPTEEYLEEYNRLNRELDNIAMSCVQYIKKQGYKALGQTSTYVTSDDDLSTALPHKTVATRAGLGWIGKNALLVTKEYGSAIRLCSVLTDMPLITNEPINESRCGNCRSCEVSCPAKAIKGSLWDVNVKREDLIDPFTCRKKARALLKEKVGVEMSLCGKCIEVCPYTKKYINAE